MPDERNQHSRAERDLEVVRRILNKGVPAGFSLALEALDSLEEQLQSVERERDHFSAQADAMFGQKVDAEAAASALSNDVTRLSEQHEVARESSESMGRALAAAHTKLTEYEKQLEAFQELAQDASDITQVGHGLELDVPVNLGSVKWVESAHRVLLTMASLAAYKIAGASDPGDAPQSGAPQSDEPSGARSAPFPATNASEPVEATQGPSTDGNPSSHPGSEASVPAKKPTDA